MGGCGRFLLVFPKETVIAMKIAVPETGQSRDAEKRSHDDGQNVQIHDQIRGRQKYEVPCLCVPSKTSRVLGRLPGLCE